MKSAHFLIITKMLFRQNNIHAHFSVYRKMHLIEVCFLQVILVIKPIE